MCRLVQKVYRISDSLAVGVSGLTFFAGHILKRLIEQQSDIRDRETLRENLTNIRQDIGCGPCDLIGWIIEERVPKCFRWSNETGVLAIVGSPTANGSGEKYFRWLTSKFKEFESPSDPLVRAVAFAGQMTGWEVTLGSSLRALFGGGSQIIYFGGNNFRNLRDVTFFFFEVDEATKGKITPHFHHRILKYQYEKELVLIQTENMGELKETNVRSFIGGSFSTEIHAAIPLYKTSAECESLCKSNPLLQPSNPEKLSYASAYFCAYATIRLLNGKNSYFVHVVPNNERQRQILVRKGQEGEDIVLTEDFFREFIGGIIQTIH